MMRMPPLHPLDLKYSCIGSFGVGSPNVIWVLSGTFRSEHYNYEGRYGQSFEWRRQEVQLKRGRHTVPVVYERVEWRHIYVAEDLPDYGYWPREVIPFP